MSVLAEAISVIVCNAALQQGYPGAVAGFAADVPAGSFCTDGLIARAGFLAIEEAEFFLGLLRASGLRTSVNGTAADCLLVDQNLGPLAPCLWLEFARTRHGTPICWHAAARRGALQVPIGWTPPADPLASDLQLAFSRQIRRIRREARTDWYQDLQSGGVIARPRAFVSH